MKKIKINLDASQRLIESDLVQHMGSDNDTVYACNIDNISYFSSLKYVFNMNLVKTHLGRMAFLLK